MNIIKKIKLIFNKKRRLQKNSSFFSKDNFLINYNKKNIIESVSIGRTNGNPFVDNFDKYASDVENKTSLFNERVFLKEKSFISTLSLQKNINKDLKTPYYSGTLSYIFDIYSAKTYKKIGETKGTYESFDSATNISSLNFIKSLNCALSGIYATPYDYEEMILNLVELCPNIHIINHYPCQECFAEFPDIHTYLLHLKATKHQDDFVKQFPYFEFY